MSSESPVHLQTSAGGVTYRRAGDRVEVALISVGAEHRWQLPKGLVEDGEQPSETARREVREETGLETLLHEPLDTIEYWYSAVRHGKRLRFHKYVHFFLLEYTGGQVTDHDHEVNEARWFEINEALNHLTFENEKKVVQKAIDHIQSQATSENPREAS